MYKRNLILTGLAVTASINVWSQQKTNHDRQNILFIVCDDLRPELGCYGRKQTSLRILIDGRHRVYYLTGRTAILLSPELPAQAC